VLAVPVGCISGAYFQGKGGEGKVGEGGRKEKGMFVFPLSPPGNPSTTRALVV